MSSAKVQDRIRRQIGAPASKRRYVRTLFASIARRYDLTNDVMSLGRHRAWKRLALGLADVRDGHVVLDLAAGTGDFAIGAAKFAPDALVVAGDLTSEMLATGRRRRGGDRVHWLQCDASLLPLPDGSVDRILIGYGLRNFPDLDWCLGEILRCLVPGGRLVTLDFGRAEPAWLDAVYLKYLDVSTALAGWVLHRSIESYRYIPESLRQYPAQRGVTELMQRRGFVRCGHIDLFSGAMAINFGQAPG